MDRRAPWARLCGRHIGDIILGANDGIITTFAVVAGVAGAQLSPTVVLVLGVANLLADGVSMGASNYLGQQSEAQAATVAGGAHTSRRGSLMAGGFTLTAFIIAGAIPLIAYLLPLDSGDAFIWATVLTGIALFVVGSARTVITGRPWWRSGLEMFAVGALAAATAYLAGYVGGRLMGTVSG